MTNKYPFLIDAKGGGGGGTLLPPATEDGSISFNPSDTPVIYITACGGGGGGASGGDSGCHDKGSSYTRLSDGTGGGGGGGSDTLINFPLFLAQFTPNDGNNVKLDVVIGQGGAGGAGGYAVGAKRTSGGLGGYNCSFQYSLPEGETWIDHGWPGEIGGATIISYEGEEIFKWQGGPGGVPGTRFNGTRYRNTSGVPEDQFRKNLYFKYYDSSTRYYEPQFEVNFNKWVVKGESGLATQDTYIYNSNYTPSENEIMHDLGPFKMSQCGLRNDGTENSDPGSFGESAGGAGGGSFFGRGPKGGDAAVLLPSSVPNVNFWGTGGAGSGGMELSNEGHILPGGVGGKGVILISY